MGRPRKDGTPAAKTCTYHCTKCGEHFHSLASFDHHRSGEWDKRFCEDPSVVRVESAEGKDKGLALQKYTEDGVCKIGDKDREGVTIWQTVSA